MSKNADLPKRLVVAFVLIGLAFAALYAGGLGFWLVVSVAGVLMMGEWALLAGANAYITKQSICDDPKARILSIVEFWTTTSRAA